MAMIIFFILYNYMYKGGKSFSLEVVSGVEHQRSGGNVVFGIRDACLEALQGDASTETESGTMTGAGGFQFVGPTEIVTG